MTDQPGPWTDDQILQRWYDRILPILPFTDELGLRAGWDGYLEGLRIAGHLVHHHPPAQPPPTPEESP